MNTSYSKGRGNRKALPAVLFAGLVAGSLDALGASIVYGPLLGKSTVANIFRGIASAVFGKRAFQEGSEMVAWGLFFHYCIALSFAVFYFLIYPHLPWLRARKWLSGLLYGIFVWCVMNLAVLPLVFKRGISLQPWPALKGMLILIVAIGLPIALLAHAWYTSRNRPVLRKE